MLRDVNPLSDIRRLGRGNCSLTPSAAISPARLAEKFPNFFESGFFEVFVLLGRILGTSVRTRGESFFRRFVRGSRQKRVVRCERSRPGKKGAEEAWVAKRCDPEEALATATGFELGQSRIDLPDVVGMIGSMRGLG